MPTDLLTAYARLWGAQQLLTTGLIKMLAASASLSGGGLMLTNVKATLYVLPAPLQVAYVTMVLSLMVLPRVPVWSLLSLHVMHMALHYSRLPEIWNSEFWDGLVEVCVGDAIDLLEEPHPDELPLKVCNARSAVEL